ncbi:MAG: HAD-IIA family hydrolase [Promethearchaeota archaeon]
MPLEKLKLEFDKKKIFIFDLDGTIYREFDLINGVDLVIEKLEKMGKIIYYLTNNATKTPMSFCKKLNKMGINAKISQIVSSGYITAQILAKEHGISSAFICGTNELVQIMEDAGIKTLNKHVPHDFLYADYLEKDIKCDAVVCAMDPTLTYAKIRTAMELINRGGEFYATNSDRTFPASGQIWPGAGMTVAAVQACVGKPPKIIFGKPQTYGIDFIFAQLSSHPSLQMSENLTNSLNQPNKTNKMISFTKNDAIVIGDRLETDIAQANNAGVDSILVETGINNRNDIPKNPKSLMEKNLIPTFVLSTLSQMFY